MASHKNRMLPNGRNVMTGRFTRLPHSLLNSPAYRSLSTGARALLVELVMLYNGKNNGSLYLSVDDAAHRMGVADHHAASRAFRELQAAGIIQMVHDAYFSVKAGDACRARRWQLTWLPGPGRKISSDEYLQFQPQPKSPSWKRMDRGLRSLKTFRKNREAGKLPVVDFTITPSSGVASTTGAVVNTTTPKVEKVENLTNPEMVETTTHIELPYHPITYVPLGWMSA